MSEPFFKTKVTIGKNPNKGIIFNDRKPGDIPLFHYITGLGDFLIRMH